MSTTADPAPREPHCVMFKIECGYVRTLRCKERQAPSLIQDFGWSMLIRDSEMPPHEMNPAQSNPRRTED